MGISTRDSFVKCPVGSFHKGSQETPIYFHPFYVDRQKVAPNSWDLHADADSGATRRKGGFSCSAAEA